MTHALTETTPRQAGIIAGIGYVVLFVSAIFANFLVLETLVVPGDAAETVANLTENEATFRLGIAAFLVIFAIDVIVAWALYVVFAPVARRLALLAAWLRVGYTVMLGVAIVFLMAVASLIASDGYASAFSTEQLDAQISLLLEAFDYAWMIGLALFGLHLGVLGVIVVMTRVAPRLLGVVLVIAGSVYILDTMFLTLMGTYQDHADLFTAMVAIPAVIAEFGFTIWLLVRAGKDTADVSGQSTDRELIHA